MKANMQNRAQSSGADQLIEEHWVYLSVSDTGSKVVDLQNAAEIS